MRRSERARATCSLFVKLASGWRVRATTVNPRIRPDLGFIMVHITKTAGNSVIEALHRQAAHAEAPGVPRIGKHAKAFEVRALLGPKTWQRCFTFAFVRNPWALMVSSYHWWLQKAPRLKYHRRRAMQVAAMGSFDAFLHSPLGRYCINERCGEMLDWITDHRGRALVDFVGRTENLQHDWPHICERIGAHPCPLPHANSSEHRPYREYYSPETCALIAKRFAPTIEMFDYEF